MLQGSLAPRNWRRHSKQSLAILPENCRPPKELTYIVAGSSSGGFHLVRVRPAPSFNVGRGGDLMWSDGIWIRDRIHLTGVMFEVAPEAVQISEYNSKDNSLRDILIREFQNCILQRL